MKHRILHIVPQLDCYATARRIIQLATGLPATEFSTTVLALSTDRTEIELFANSGIHPVVTGWRGEFDLVSIGRIWRQIRSCRPEVVQIWLPGSGATHAWAAAIGAGVKRLIVSIDDVAGPKELPAVLAQKWLTDRVQQFICNSQAVCKLVQSAGIKRERIAVVPSGIEPASHGQSTRGDFLAQHRLPPEAKIIACLSPWKQNERIKELIWAIDQLKAVGSAAHLFLMGHGPQAARLQRYSRLNRTEDRVHFVARPVSVSNLLPRFDVYWHPKQSRGQSIAMLEAMAAGLPVVAADAPGSREVVVDSQTGFLVPPSERAGFARSTLPLLENADQAQQIGAAGKDRVIEHFSLEKMLTNYSALYRQ